MSEVLTARLTYEASRCGYGLEAAVLVGKGGHLRRGLAVLAADADTAGGAGHVELEALAVLLDAP
jgi:hypothetical protein